MPPKKTYSLFFVEGDTEEEFYKKEVPRHFHGLRKKLFNLGGNFNIHRKILGKTLDFINKKSDCTVRIYCCIDRESRSHNPPLDIEVLRNTFKNNPLFKSKVLSADTIIATQMIESWFFYDIEGIYKFLKTPKKDRKTKTYIPPEKFTHIDLSNLFKRYNKTYIKGKKCSFFIDHLDTVKIYNNCQEFKDGLAKVKT